MVADNQTQRKIILEHALAIIREHRFEQQQQQQLHRLCGRKAEIKKKKKPTTRKPHVKWYENKNQKKWTTSAMKREKMYMLWRGCKKNALHLEYERIYHFKNYVFGLCVFVYVRDRHTERKSARAHIFCNVSFSAQLFPSNSFHLWHFAQNYLFVYSFAFRFHRIFSHW